MVTSLGLFVFFVPPETGEKISFGMNVLLAFAVFLLLIAEKYSEDNTSFA